MRISTYWCLYVCMFILTYCIVCTLFALCRLVYLTHFHFCTHIHAVVIICVCQIFIKETACLLVCIRELPHSCNKHLQAFAICSTFVKNLNKYLAIANRSRVSCAHNRPTPRVSTYNNP